MPVGFNSPARNFFLLGSSGDGVVGNFFDTIDRSAGTDGVYLPDEIRYNYTDQKYLLAGSASDSASKSFGWFEKRDETGALEFDVRVEAGAGVNTTLRAMELDSNNNLIVAGFSGTAPWIAKYSNSGVLDWQSTTFSANVRYLGLTSDSNGNYYACGRTSYLLPDTQAFVEKFDTNGNPSWGKSAFMLGRDVVLKSIAANSRGEVVAVGFLEDDSADKGYIVKIDTNTGDVLWDRTLSPDAGIELKCTDVYIDNQDQIYVSLNGTDDGYLVKYTPEGNIQWQRKTAQSSGSITYDQVFSDGETQQTVVFGTYTDSGDTSGLLTKYSRNGDLVWRRTLTSSFNNSDTFSSVCLDGDPSFYYFMYIDGIIDGLNGTPDAYTFGKVSSSGNGLGAFQYTEGTGETIDYVILNEPDKIGRLSDGSVRHDTSDLIAYPFGATKIMFDDLASKVTNKKRQMDDADSFEYSGSPAIRPADFQELNLLGDVGITEGVDNTPTIGTIVYGTDNADNSFDATNDGSLVLDTTGYTFNTWSGSQLMSALGGFGANSAQVWRTTNFDSVLWTISTDTSKRYIYTSDDGINWIQSTDLYSTEVAPVNVTSKWLATSAGANVSTITVSGVPGGTNYSNRWDATVNYNHGGNYAFDGSESTRVEPKDNQTVTWTAGTAIPVGSTLEFNILRAGTIGASDFQVNGTNYGGSVPSSQGWITIPESSLSSFSLFHNSGTSSVEVFAVRIDGSILTDGDGVPTGTSTPGAWADQSGKGNDGVVNSATHNAAGYFEFDGVDDKIVIDSLSNFAPSEVTFEAWFKKPTGSGYKGLVDKGRDNYGAYTINVDETGNKATFTAKVSGVNAAVVCATEYGSNVWTHVVGTYDGTDLKIYLNGSLDGTTNIPGVLGSNTVPVTIGSTNDGLEYGGEIGEVRIYPRALTAAAVFQNYNATKEKYTGVAASTNPGLTSTRTP